MKVIARKKKGLEALYFSVIILGIVFLSIGSYSGAPFLLIGLICVILGLWIFIDILLIPNDIIKLDNDKLVLPKNISIQLKEITDISYRKARARSIQYSWGTIIISSHGQKYKYRYIKDCEQVSKEITKLVFQAQHEDIV